MPLCNMAIAYLWVVFAVATAASAFGPGARAGRACGGTKGLIGSCPIRPPSDETVMLQVGSVSMSVKSADGQPQRGGRIGRASGQRDNASNICIGDHLAPELFILGAIKDATTSFASKLSVSPSIVFASAGTDPRVHESGNDTGTEAWLKEPLLFNDCPSLKERIAAYYPSCTQEKRLVAFDGTPYYLADSGVRGCISTAYGKDSDRLKFVILLHEPAAHLQSLFYSKNNYGLSPTLTRVSFRTSSFREFVEELLNNGANFVSWDADKQLGGTMSSKDDITKNDPVAGLLIHTFYADQIAEYFKVFSPDQFTVVPMKLYVRQHTPQSPVDLVLASVGLPPVPDAVADEAEIKNTGHHPTLDEDLDATTLARLRAFLDTYTGASEVARVLVTLAPSASVPSLFGYAGPHDSQAAIAQWLTESW